MSVGWVGLLIGCMFALAFLFAVAMGCAAARGDRQNRRAAERARALERKRALERDAANVTRLNDWLDPPTPPAPSWPGAASRPAYGKLPPFDQEKPQSADELLREGFEGARRAWEEGQ